jgi:hypothetical protein
LLQTLRDEGGYLDGEVVASNQNVQRGRRIKDSTASQVEQTKAFGIQDAVS